MTRNQRRRSLQRHRSKMRWAQKNKAWLAQATRDVGCGYYTSIEHIWSEYEYEVAHGQTHR